MRLAVLGRGKWGANIVRTLAAMPNVELIEESKNVALILRQQPAGVVIATPSTTHAELALQFINAGLPTYIEKPMTTTVDDALRLRDAALSSGAPVFVGHVQLYNPAFQAALKLLPGFESIQTVFWEGMNHPPRTDSSVLWDWLPHALSMAHAIFGGSPNLAQAWGIGEAACFHGVIANFMFGGVPLIASANWLSPLKRHRLTIVGDNQWLTFDDTAEQKLTLRNSQGTSYPAYDGERPLTRELREFVSVIQRGAHDPAQLDRKVAIIQAIAAAEESARNAGQPVAIASQRS
jgi:predicted dehydrogenase